MSGCSFNVVRSCAPKISRTASGSVSQCTCVPEEIWREALTAALPPDLSGEMIAAIVDDPAWGP